ncbi:monosaccharide ABC transporter substrate-binding protein, CUT2 family [Roseovarius pacificus]|uniref:Monosaccharide ABC transporter substrate-binding protein, CUT2 family n=1 Tax=Roseovarius pacificus TaxID=337701 RepID=A0A1M7KPA5_9RHOB|nr:TMAO reductase system periplasmic protein TorT [Roseovarius pacificus]GGO62837.1 TMAO reductase system periplasmic protein TorT [Roseovarius pacificus]SHM67263.1 monosaccharide ABC transporter substrate-binding protein, CUT2 family [Roseovarius pacificus]
MKNMNISVAAAAIAVFSGSPAAAKDWFPYPVNIWEPPFVDDAVISDGEYVPLDKADQQHQLCVSFPHMKDAYWMAVNYGVVEEARRLGVNLQITEAGGYTELNNQISQIEDCVAGGGKALILGAISFDGLNNIIGQLKQKGVPVVDMINGVSSQDIAAKAIVSWRSVGRTLGQYLAEQHPAGSDPVKLAWFPGPAGAGFVEDATSGFKEGIEGSAVELVEVRYGDTGKEVQTRLIEDALQTYPDLDYVAGSAVAAEAGISVLRSNGLTDKVRLMSYYYTPGVDQGIRRGQVLAAPTDSTVIQSRIAVDQAVRILEGKGVTQHVAPQIFIINKDNVDIVDMNAVLAPGDFRPIFTVE